MKYLLLVAFILALPITAEAGFFGGGSSNAYPNDPRSYYSEVSDKAGNWATYTDGVSGSNATGHAVGRPGKVITLSTGTAANGFASVEDIYNIISGTDTLYFEVVASIPTLADGTDDYEAFIGLYNDTAAGDMRAAVDQIGFYYDRDTSANWILRTNNDGISTNTASSTPVTTGYHRFGISVAAAGTLVAYYLDGVSLGTVSSNIPTGTGDIMAGIAAIDKEAGTTARTLSVDYFAMIQTLTNPR